VSPVPMQRSLCGALTRAAPPRASDAASRARAPARRRGPAAGRDTRAAADARARSPLSLHPRSVPSSLSRRQRRRRRRRRRLPRRSPALGSEATAAPRADLPLERLLRGCRARCADADPGDAARRRGGRGRGGSASGFDRHRPGRPPPAFGCGGRCEMRQGSQWPGAGIAVSMDCVGAGQPDSSAALQAGARWGVTYQGTFYPLTSRHLLLPDDRRRATQPIAVHI
jgi:hypothetical protein